MALDLKELCRLCGKKDEFSKDLKDEDNKNIHKMIQEFIQIPFAEHDELPTKVCLNCEEKIESFQLFIVECYNMQETLRQMCLETCEKYPIKLEDETVLDFNNSQINSEVNHEMSAEDLVNAINSDECMTGFDADDYNNDDDDNDMSDVNRATLKDLKQEKTSERKIMTLNETGKQHLKEISDGFDADDYNNDNDDDGMSDVTLATLKDLKQQKTSERKIMTLTETRKQHLKEISDGFDADNYNNDNDDDDMSDVTVATLKDLKQKKTSKRKIMTLPETGKQHLKEKSDLNIGDFVKFQCNICNIHVKRWTQLSVHYKKIHKSEPELKCVCGFIITSRISLYRHVSDHRSDISKRMYYEKKYSNLNVSDFVNFTCSVCQKQCKSWYHLKTHSKNFHNTKPVAKCICGKSLKSHSTVYKHVYDHKNPNIISCDKCPKITETLSAMITHKMRHIPKSERKFCCSSCDKVFTSKWMLRGHMRSHMPIEERKIYSCDLCEVKFTTPKRVKAHRRVVHFKIKSHVCDVCGHACRSGSDLRQHRVIHSDDRPFACRTCGKRFKTSPTLKRHEETHEGKLYVCPVCSRVLSSRASLRDHRLVHDDERPHVCPDCNKAFKRQSVLKVHMRRHTGLKPLACKWCDERFTHGSALRLHRLRRHPDEMAALPTTRCYPLVQEELKNDAIPSKTDVEAI